MLLQVIPAPRQAPADTAPAVDDLTRILRLARLVVDGAKVSDIIAGGPAYAAVEITLDGTTTGWAATGLVPSGWRATPAPAEWNARTKGA